MLSKSFEHQAFEKDCYTNWKESKAFQCDPSSSTSPYCIMMPPPNVTGSLHLGHALTYTLQDILIRYYRMKGHDTLWQPGTDHAGIATQMIVERQLNQKGLTRQELGREKFLEKIWEWKEESGNTIVSQQQALGITPDWDRQVFTLDEGPSAAVKKVFVQLYNEGLIYKDKRLVNWDTALQTAVSDLEVNQEEQKGELWYIRYPIENSDEFITIATTRPETMLGDTAVAVHPDDERYKHLIGKNVILPIANRLIPIIADSYCDPEKGSGAVKITPAHDFNDFEVGKRNQLDIINILDPNGKLNTSVPSEYQGLDVNTARKKVLEELTNLGFYSHSETIKNTIPISERSRTIIQPLLTDQWYVKAAVLAKPAIEAVKDGRIKFYPEQWANNYLSWLENIQPWCISRQLWWGHQIPAWYGPDGAYFVAENVEEALSQATKHYGKEVALIQDQDVLDTWFSSALWPFSTLKWPEKTIDLSKYYPTSVLVTGFDIIFFWVARMIMMGLHFMKDVPFRDIYIHALVRDEKGEKMSKTRGNVIDPLEVIEKYGADALRFCLAGLSVPGRDIKLGEQRIATNRNFITKLWNAARFLQMNDVVIKEETDTNGLRHPLNQWIISELNLAIKKTEIDIESYRFDEACSTLYHFFWSIFCDEYLEYLKVLLKGDDAEETKEVGGYVFAQILHLLNPFTPYVTEKLWTDLGGNHLLIGKLWPKPNTITADLASVKELRRLIAEIRSLRGTLKIAPTEAAQVFCHDVKFEDSNFPQVFEHMTKSQFVTSYKTENSVTFVIGPNKYTALFGQDFDLDKTKGILQNQCDQLAKELEHLDKKLSNQAFKEAKPDLYEQDLQFSKAKQIEIEKLSQILKGL